MCSVKVRPWWVSSDLAMMVCTVSVGACRQQSVAQGDAEVLGDGSAQQEVLHGRRLAVEHLLQQVLQHERLRAPGACPLQRCCPGGARAVVQRDGGQAQARRPAFGAGLERLHLAGGKSEPLHTIQ